MKLSAETTGRPGNPRDQDENIAGIPRHSWRRKIARVALWLMGGLCVLAGMAPRILSLPACHRLVTQRITRDVAGHLDVGKLRLRWFTPPVMEQVRFAAPDDQPVLEIDRCLVSCSPWSFLRDPSTFGELRLEAPTFYLLLHGQASNLSEAIKPTRVDEVPSKTIEFLKSIQNPAGGRILVQNGRFVFQSDPQRERIELQPFGMSAVIHPRTAETGPTVSLEPCQLAQRIVLSRDLCNDLLKFVAPVLAEAAWVQGAFSAELESGLLSLDDVQKSTMQGQLQIHQIAAGPGPIVAQIARLVGAPDSIQLVDESRIHFQMSHGRIRHRGLRFQLGRFRAETSGAVNLDESMNLVVAVQFPQEDASGTELGTRLAGRVVQIPITGTLGHPRIDWPQLAARQPLIYEWMLQRLQHPEQTPILDALREFRSRGQQPDVPADRPVLRRLFPGLMRTLDASGLGGVPQPAPPTNQSPNESTALPDGSPDERNSAVEPGDGGSALVARDTWPAS